MRLICLCPQGNDAARARLGRGLVEPLSALGCRVEAWTPAPDWARRASVDRPDAVLVAWWGRDALPLSPDDADRLRQAGIPLLGWCSDTAWTASEIRWHLALRADGLAGDVSPVETLWPTRQAGSRLAVFAAGAGQAAPAVAPGTLHVTTLDETPLGPDWGGLLEAMGAGATCLVARDGLLDRVLPGDCVAFFDDAAALAALTRRAETDPAWARKRGAAAAAWFAALPRTALWREVLKRLLAGQDGCLAMAPFTALLEEPVPVSEALAAVTREITVSRAMAAPLAGPESGRIWCHHPWYNLELEASGAYGPCCLIRHGAPSVPGNVPELMERWNAPELQALRRRLVTGQVAGTICEDCYLRLLQSRDSLWGMSKRLPRVSTHDSPAFDARYARAQAAYAAGSAVLDEPPLSLYALTSQRCNLRCVMCQQDHADPALFPIDRLLELTRSVGFDTLDRFGFVGGEIFCNPDSLALLAILASDQPSGVCLMLLTNGVLLDRHVDRLAALDNILWIVSIDGYGPRYEAIRRGARFDRVWANLTHLAALTREKPHWRLYVNSLVMATSVPSLDSLLHGVQDLGGQVFFMPVMGGHPDEDVFVQPGLVPPRELDRALARTRETARRLDADRAEHSLGAVMRSWAAKVRERGRLDDRLRHLAGTGTTPFALEAAQAIFSQRSPDAATLGALAAKLAQGCDAPAMDAFFTWIEDQHPGEVTPANLHAAYHLDRGRPDLARPILEKAARRDPASRLYLWNLARCQRDSGALVQARETAAQALKLGIRDPELRAACLALRDAPDPAS